MRKGFDSQTKVDYPGRVICMGLNPAKSRIVMYAITGRSPSSQARMLEYDTEAGSIYVKPTDQEALKTGNPDLLIYPAIMFGQSIVVSNGKQTENIFQKIPAGVNPVTHLSQRLLSWSYEPDEPNYTPRISGCIIADTAALSILKHADDGSVERQFFQIPLAAGLGKMISTYAGHNASPLPSFQGEPLNLEMPWASARDAANALYEFLAPAPAEPDYRVAAAAAMSEPQGGVTVHIVNRNQQASM